MRHGYHRRDVIKAGCMIAASLAMPSWLRACASVAAFSDHGAVALSGAIVDEARAALERHRSSLLHADVIGIADFGQYCSRPRFHLVNIESGAIDSLLVAHGEGSDPDDTGWLETFSNAPGSRATSAGSYLTDEGYEGQYGPSRRVFGLDPENSNAYDRAIVIHPAEYVSLDLARRIGRIGTSWGCFAFSQDDIAMVLDRLGPGRLIHACRLSPV